MTSSNLNSLSIVVLVIAIVIIIIVLWHFMNRWRVERRIKEHLRRRDSLDWHGSFQSLDNFLVQGKHNSNRRNDIRRNDSGSSSSSPSDDEPCPRISAPIISVTYNPVTEQLNISWTNSDSEEYDIEVIGQDNSVDIKISHYNGTQIYVPVDFGIYYIYVTPINGDCFGPTGKYAPFIASRCPTPCVAPASICYLDTCVQCVTSSDCTNNAPCIGGVCACPIPVVTAITISALWPAPVPWTFTIANAPATGNRFTFGWKVYGTAGPSMPPVSGYSPNALFPNNQFDANAASPLVYECVEGVEYGCPTAGCTVGDTVFFEINNLVVTTPCGSMSAATCWLLASPCNNLSFTLIPCPAP
jgi:hypothetical protein